MSKLTAADVRAVLYEAVPEYAQLPKMCVKCTAKNDLSVGLMLGLLDAKTEAIYNAVGLIEDNKTKIIAAFKKLHNLNVTINTGTYNPRTRFQISFIDIKE